MPKAGDMLVAVYESIGQGSSEVVDANIVSVNDVLTTSVDDFKADSVNVDYDLIANAVWGQYDADGGVVFANEDKELIRISKEMLFNKAVVSTDKRLVYIYEDDKTTLKHIIDVSADNLIRTPR